MTGQSKLPFVGGRTREVPNSFGLVPGPVAQGGELGRGRRTSAWLELHGPRSGDAERRGWGRYVDRAGLAVREGYLILSRLRPFAGSPCFRCAKVMPERPTVVDLLQTGLRLRASRATT